MKDQKHLNRNYTDKKFKSYVESAFDNPVIEFEVISHGNVLSFLLNSSAMNGKTISTRKETVDEIMQALSISPENPLCILHQEIAKTFLINSDPGKKYQVHIHLPIVIFSPHFFQQFYMKVSQLDQIKQAYEQGVWTIESLMQRVNTMKQVCVLV